MNGTPNWHKFGYEGIVVNDFYKEIFLYKQNEWKPNTYIVRSPFYTLGLRMNPTLIQAI